jgi:hypothetical protein
MNSTEKDTPQTNTINLNQWCEHYKNLWHDPLNKTINRDKIIEAEEVDQIITGELKLAQEN